MYKGNITIAPNIPAPMIAPRIDVNEKVWFLKRVRGMIGSTAFDSHLRNRTVSATPVAM